MGMPLAALRALEALVASRGRAVSATSGVPFNMRVRHALQRLRGDTEGGPMALSWNNEVLRLLGAGGTTVVEPSVRAETAKTGDYVITVADIEAGTTFNVSPSGGSATMTLPTASGWTGRSVRVANKAAVGSGKTVVVDGDGSETVAGDATITLQPGDAYSFESDGSNVAAF